MCGFVMRKISLLILAPIYLGLVASALAQQLSREEALMALRDGNNVEARRQGVEWLGQTGLMADVPALVEALRDPDELVRTLAEQSLWQVWSRSGDPGVDGLFQRGLEQMNRQDAEAAVESFNEIIQQKPDFAEGWNKRATLYYLIGEYEKSLADCEEVIKRNPVHFGALSGFGLNYLQLQKPEQALEYFQRALDVNPNLAQIQDAVEAIKEFLSRQRRDSI
jgi:tetratricopeptide (TPR) repeat protein